MINKINLCNYPKINQRKNTTQLAFKQNMPMDTVEINDSTRYNQAYLNAKKQLISTLRQTNTECGTIINSKGRITDDFTGAANKYLFNNAAIEPNSTIIIGRTINLPLSTEDIAQLLASDAHSIETITKDGQYSKLTKNDSNIKLKNKEKTAKALTHRLYNKAAQAAGISLKPTKSEFLELAKDYIYNSEGKEFNNKSYEEILEELSHQGFKPSNDTSLNYRQLTKLCKGYTFYETETKYKRILRKEDEINAFLNTPKGFEVIQDFIQDIAEKYDLTYETNMVP